MAVVLPPPREFGWTLKPVESAKTSFVRLGDGRLELRIRHEVIRGIDTAMLAWWFQHLDTDVTYRGATWHAYLLWHPADHVRLRATRDGGRIGPGCRIHIQEVFARDGRFTVDQEVTIHRWDASAIGFHVDRLGHRVFELDHVFEDVAGGVDYRSCLRVGAGAGPLRAVVNAQVRRRFTDEMGRAWLRHNVEEVGCFEHFLPEIHAARTT